MGYDEAMRFARLPMMALVFAPWACSTTSSSTESDASLVDEFVIAAEDGNTVGCTSLGGTCIPFAQECPVLQQNTALCEDTIMVCCLPEGGPRLVEPAEGGEGEPDSTASDVAIPMEAATRMDSGLPMDAGGGGGDDGGTD